jgi:DNA (cytosine-5)-methyltransferase 1
MKAAKAKAPKAKAPKAIDLFAGAGGVTQGLKDGGFRVVGAVELDPLCVKTYKENHRRVRVWPEDIRKVSIEKMLIDLDLEVGELDLLAGCPPCQGFSRLRTLQGKRAIEDVGKDLIFEFERFVKGLRPKTIMLENVPGLRNDNRMLRFRGTLDGLGYRGEPLVLNAADYGVPQRRKRLVFVASRLGTVDKAPVVSTRRTVRETIGNLEKAGNSGDPLHDVSENRTAKVAALIRQIPHDGGSRMDLKTQLPCHERCNGFFDVYGRMSWDEVAPTITSGCFNPSKGRFLHPKEDRTITLREAALLQSFPADYKFSLSNGKLKAALLIGNAFPPEFVRHHAVMVFQHLKNAGNASTVVV